MSLGIWECPSVKTSVCFVVTFFRCEPSTHICLSDDFHRDPVESVHEMTLAADGRPEGGKGVSSTTKQQNGIEGLTLAELSAKWNNVVETLNGDGVEVINSDHALEGALSIRCAYSAVQTQSHRWW